MEITDRLPAVLLPWYRENRRDLPWRKDRDPYHVWISEIMLQQTRVEAVREYYLRFLEALPTLDALADCDDALLQKLWEGLGYYSRMRNLKKAAMEIRDRFGGVFPSDPRDILSLPGIGEYTCGAISSISFGNPIPAVDGNVLRVIARIQNDSTPIDTPAFKKDITSALANIYPEDAGSFTQALMELGATVCGPNRKPDCERCPCRDFCGAFAAGTQKDLPVKLPKKEKKEEAWTVFILRCADRYALVKRPVRGLLAGLWQFPAVSGTLEPQQALKSLLAMGFSPADMHRQTEKNHIFTHKIWIMRGYYLTVQEEAAGYSWFSMDQIRQEVALPTAFRQFLDDGMF